MKSNNNRIPWYTLAVLSCAVLATTAFFMGRDIPPQADVPPDEIAICEAADDIGKALAFYMQTHGQYPTSLTEIPASYFPSGFNTSFLARFTYASSSEKTEKTTSGKYTLERIFESQQPPAP